MAFIFSYKIMFWVFFNFFLFVTRKLIDGVLLMKATVRKQRWRFYRTAVQKITLFLTCLK